jgi:hypothetical protein
MRQCCAASLGLANEQVYLALFYISSIPSHYQNFHHLLPRIYSKPAPEEHFIMNNRDTMNTADAIDQHFTDGFNHAHDLFLADRLEECEAAAFALLREETIPRYHKMRTLILLGTIVGDWEEARMYHVAADGMWRIVRQYHPVGADEGVERALAELRELLDDLNDALMGDEEDEALDTGLDNTADDEDEEDGEDKDVDSDAVSLAT